MTFKGCRNDSSDLYHEGVLIPNSENDSVVGGGFKCPNSSWQSANAKWIHSVPFPQRNDLHYQAPLWPYPWQMMVPSVLQAGERVEEMVVSSLTKASLSLCWNSIKLTRKHEFVHVLYYLIADMYIISLIIWYWFIAIYKERVWFSGCPIVSHYENDHEISAMSLSHWANWGFVHTMYCMYIVVQVI